MRAAILYGKEQVRIEEVPAPPLRLGEVRVRIEAALTCGTDLKVFRRGYHARMIVPPAVFGHELSGIISEVGPETHGWKVGDRVAAANSAPCGACFFCRERQENLCDDLLFLNGAYAESIVIPERIVQKNLLRLAPQTGFRDAALVEPLACVVQGIEDTRLGQKVLVIGAGPIGLMFVALAKALGCEVSVAGRRAARLQAARNLGAMDVIEIGAEESVATTVRKQTDTRFDAVIEAVGKPETWEASLQLVRKGGAVNLFGGCPSGTSISLDTTLLHYSNLHVLASFHHTPRSIRRALEWIENGTIHAADFIDGTSSLSALPELFRSMTQGNKAVKTFIDVRA